MMVTKEIDGQQHEWAERKEKSCVSSYKKEQSSTLYISFCFIEKAELVDCKVNVATNSMSLNTNHVTNSSTIFFLRINSRVRLQWLDLLPCVRACLTQSAWRKILGKFCISIFIDKFRSRLHRKNSTEKKSILLLTLFTTNRKSECDHRLTISNKWNLSRVTPKSLFTKLIHELLLIAGDLLLIRILEYYKRGAHMIRRIYSKIKRLVLQKWWEEQEQFGAYWFHSNFEYISSISLRNCFKISLLCRVQKIRFVRNC